MKFEYKYNDLHPIKRIWNIYICIYIQICIHGSDGYGDYRTPNKLFVRFTILLNDVRVCPHTSRLVHWYRDTHPIAQCQWGSPEGYGQVDFIYADNITTKHKVQQNCEGMLHVRKSSHETTSDVWLAHAQHYNSPSVLTCICQAPLSQTWVNLDPIMITNHIPN